MIAIEGNNYRAEIEDIFTGESAVFALVEYIGDIVDRVSKIPNARIYVINENRAIISVIDTDIEVVIEELSDVIAFLENAK